MTEKQLNAIKRVIDADPVSITPQDAAEIIGAHPQALRDACRDGTQGFPVYISGGTIKIPTRPFFEFWGLTNTTMSTFFYEKARPVYEKRHSTAAEKPEDNLAALVAAERKNNNA